MSKRRFWCSLLACTLLVLYGGERVVHAETPRKLYVLVVADTVDRSIGKSVQRDRNNVLGFFSATFAKHREQLGLFYLDGELSRKDLFDALKKIEKAVSKEDAFLVYFSGHGDNDARQGHRLKVGNDMVPRDEVLQQMRKANPHVCLLITDSCNVAPHPGKAPPLRMSEDGVGADWKTAQALFFEAGGTLNLNAASKGEFALCDQTGSIFTNALLSTLRTPFGKRDGEDKSVNWEKVLSLVQEKMTMDYRKLKEVSVKHIIDRINRGQDKIQLGPLITLLDQFRRQTNQTMQVWSKPAPAR